jgi:hypothetical protein
VGEWFGVDAWWDLKQRGFDAVSQVLVLLAGGASLDVFRDPCFGARPEIFSVDASDCFVSSGVAIDGTFVPDVH